MEKERIYIHYGSNHFNRKMLKRNVERGGSESFLNKPKNSLWGSPIESKNSWKNFCEREEFRLDTLKFYFKFKLNSSAKVLIINEHNTHMLNKYLVRRGSFCMIEIDWSRIAKDYDAFVVTFPENWKKYMDFEDKYNLHAWDVDSICVFNPNVVEEVR